MEKDDLNARIQRLTQRIVEQGGDIQREMRDVALSAVRDGRLDRDHVSALVGAVMKGVHAARDKVAPPPPTSPLAQALRGLEDALGASAEALKLALQEAMTRSRDVGARELQRGRDELAALQSLFAEVVKNLSQGSQQAAHQTWDDFAAHLSENSTRLGAQLTDIAAQIQRYLDQQAQHSARGASEAATRTVDALANAAADALSRVADALRRGADKK